MTRLQARAIKFSAVFLGLLVCAAVGWFRSRIDLQPYYVVAAPLFVLLCAAPDTWVLFRDGRFWWISAAFVLASTIVVSQLELAPRGSSAGRWFLIVLGEGVVFVTAVTLLNPTGWPEGNRDSHD